MTLFKSTKYRKCVKNEDGSVDCVAYKPTRDGKKVVTANVKAIVTPECNVSVVESDGDPNDIADLEEYLGKNARGKCKKESEL